MNDFELTSAIKNLKWDVNLKNRTVKSEFIHYRIIPGNGYKDLQAEWISQELPAVASVLNEIQRNAAEAYRKAVNFEIE